ncbi:hypothetical protein PRK78_006481 [Emydomyces testavorans]|uniref:PH domain-containing protein n=1 Tax=Emydomyces testavorans TaxID=2070801 RepID=A0AAF0DLU3_9EURO|nr:hypothetical protein PRK78_006481 [Emydomyces testavorans]
MPLTTHPQSLGDNLQALRNDRQPLKPNVPRGEFLGPDTFSPVNQNGSFEFDRVLRRGRVLQRSKNKHSFKASWKPGYLVLRPNLLSLYKDEDEAQLRLAITLSDISTVAHVRAPRSKRPNVFGIFSPSKNYRFQAPSQAEADTWVDQIRRECTAEYPDTVHAREHVHDRRMPTMEGEESGFEMSDHDGQKSDHACSLPHSATAPRRPNFLDISGNDITSCSDFSDVPPRAVSHHSTGSLGHHERASLSPARHAERQPPLRRYTSRQSDVEPRNINLERVIFDGYLSCLKIKKGVRQWKRLWAVLRPEKLSFYKNEREYSAIKIIPLDQVIDAAEVDPISRSKVHCFQLITEETTYRFCAPDEEALDNWLGSLKSVLTRAHEGPSYQTAGQAMAGSSSGMR